MADLYSNGRNGSDTHQLMLTNTPSLSPHHGCCRKRCECLQRPPEAQKPNDDGSVNHPLMNVRGDDLGVRDSIGVLRTAACVYDSKGDVGHDSVEVQNITTSVDVGSVGVGVRDITIHKCRKKPRVFIESRYLLAAESDT